MMGSERRIGTTAAVAFGSVAVTLAVAAGLDRLGTPLEVLQVAAAAPVIAVVIAGLKAGSLGFADVVRGGAWRPGAIAAATAAFAAPASVLLAVPAGLAAFGLDAFGIAAAVPVGLLLAIGLVAPRFQATGAATLAEAIGRRSGPLSRRLAALAVIAALVPIAVAEAALAGRIAEAMTGIDTTTAAQIAASFAGLIVIFGGLRAAIAAGVIAVLFAGLGIVATLVIAAWIGDLGLSYASLPAEGPAPGLATALTAIVLLGTLALPTLSTPSATSLRRQYGRAALLALAGTSAMLLFAMLFFAAEASGIGAELGPVLGLASRPDLPVVLPIFLTGGLFASAVAAVAAAIGSAAVAIGQDLYPALERKAPDGRRIFIARLAAILIAIVVGGVAGLDLRPAFLGLSGLGIAAAALAPVLLLGRTRTDDWPAAPAIAVGLVTAAGGPLVAGLMPGIWSAWLGIGPTAGGVLGPDGPFGLPVAVSGLFGAAAGAFIFIAAAVADRYGPRNDEEQAKGAG